MILLVFSVFNHCRASNHWNCNRCNYWKTYCIFCLELHLELYKVPTTLLGKTSVKYMTI